MSADTNTIACLDRGYVKLESYSANEKLFADIAWSSRGKEGNDYKRTIQTLIRQGHTGPFEASLFVFQVKAPVFVARQWMRHRIGIGYTELSQRYALIPAEFYCVDPLDQVVYEREYSFYREAVELGQSLEQARRFLPIGTYTQFYCYGNLVAFMHFLELRLAKEAQAEIREYANALDCFISTICPVTMLAWHEIKGV